MTLAEQIVELLKQKPGLSDRQITDQLFGVDKPPQSVNIVCRNLEEHGILLRRKTYGNPIGNYLAGKEVEKLQVQKTKPEMNNEEHFSEAVLKKVLAEWLIAQGWTVKVAWGYEHGIDIDAKKENERWIIEVKGQGSLNPMRVNYFLGILGETLQRMKDQNAKYSIALPDMQQFRNLWQRLPSLAKSRTEITAIFVNEQGSVIEIP
jgi:hypothetical protein